MKKVPRKPRRDKGREDPEEEEEGASPVKGPRGRGKGPPKGFWSSEESFVAEGDQEDKSKDKRTGPKHQKYQVKETLPCFIIHLQVSYVFF